MLRELKENYEREKAKLRGEARSEARMIKQAKDIPGLLPERQDGPPQGVPGAFVRMKDGAPMQFHTDGSLRHAFGKNLSKAAKKRAKKARRHAAAQGR